MLHVTIISLKDKGNNIEVVLKPTCTSIDPLNFWERSVWAANDRPISQQCSIAPEEASMSDLIADEEAGTSTFRGSWQIVLRNYHEKNIDIYSRKKVDNKICSNIRKNRKMKNIALTLSP